MDDNPVQVQSRSRASLRTSSAVLPRVSLTNLVWLALLRQLIERKVDPHTVHSVTMLHRRYDLAGPSSVHKAMRVPREMGITELSCGRYVVRDPHRFLLLFAARRNVAGEVKVRAEVRGGVRHLERSLPEGWSATSIAGYIRTYGERFEDHQLVYLYAPPDGLARLVNGLDVTWGQGLLRPAANGPVRVMLTNREIPPSQASPVSLWADLFHDPQPVAGKYLEALSTRLGLSLSRGAKRDFPTGMEALQLHATDRYPI